MEIHVTVQVHCLKPSWVNDEKNNYRLYANGELLTERTWAWGISSFVEEDIWINVKADSTVNIKLESILKKYSVAKFALQEVKLNNSPVDIAVVNENTELEFKIHKYTIPRKIEHETLRIYQRRARK
jgi:hypothetical protein